MSLIFYLIFLWLIGYCLGDGERRKPIHSVGAGEAGLHAAGRLEPGRSNRGLRRPSQALLPGIRDHQQPNIMPI